MRAARGELGGATREGVRRAPLFWLAGKEGALQGVSEIALAGQKMTEKGTWNDRLEARAGDK